MKKSFPSSNQRRRVMRVLALSAVALSSGRASGQSARPACVLTPAQTEGPYFVDERLDRADLRTDPVRDSVLPGVPLSLALRVSRINGSACAPLAGAIVDVWHCDARGVYSDTAGARGTKFLRGYQRTDDAGNVRFTTIYPGAYPGRAVHIHFKVRTRDADFTSQLYFDDALTDRVHAQAPYGGVRGRRTRNTSDFLYRRGGDALTLDVERRGDGYAAAYDVGVRL
jgi:protocatechuate 3,4-dioxygenase beta subunit